MTELTAFLDEQGLLRVKHESEVMNIKIAVHSILHLQADFHVDALKMTVASLQQMLKVQGITDVSAGQLENLVKPFLKPYEPPTAAQAGGLRHD